MIEASDDKTVYSRVEEISESDLNACAEISGEVNDPPLGIAYVMALRTVIGSGLLPDGAMMLGHRATWFEAPRPGRFETEMRFSEADPPRTRFQRVVIAYRTFDRNRGGELVLEQEQEVLWPIIG
ncbi:hypothetical protein KAJ83_16085 [Marivibrio halodurans]|uniref:Uncharacterized protein n=1 Tax=Marivibrio halodurans TaxID=2039722 RepID=A0A8J7S1C4_9PROT|nr:hypothetical protein [Marivibrio halodurans]MBP5858542.1 hypothetical protein [Marivibrio halodurans]